MATEVWVIWIKDYKDEDWELYEICRTHEGAEKMAQEGKSDFPDAEFYIEPYSIREV